MSLRCRLLQLCIARLLIILGVLLAVAVIIGEPPANAGKSEVTIGGPFTLSTPEGTTVTDRTYRGKWLLVYFGYTFCPSSCPTTLLAVTAALEELGQDAAQVQPLFITVDPQRDTPKVIRCKEASDVWADRHARRGPHRCVATDAVARHSARACGRVNID